MYPIYPYWGFEINCDSVPITFPPQHQLKQPGIESIMIPRPIYNNPYYQASGKLMGKVAIVTGGDSGIGRAVALAFAKEGSDLAIVYLYERFDAFETKSAIERVGRKCLLIEGDLRDEQFSKKVVAETLKYYGHFDILVNNIGVSYPQNSILDISSEQLENTFITNVFSFFHMTKASLPYLKRGSTIINTSSVAAYEGYKELIDYSASKGAVVSFTKSLSQSLIEKGIRVNAVAPGPVWTPLIPSSFPIEAIKSFGLTAPMKRAAQPFELAPTYVYLASDDSKYVTGQVIHVNGGSMVD